MPDRIALFSIEEEKSGGGFSLRDLIITFFKYWATAALCLIVVSLLTWGALAVQPPIYESSAKVWVQTEQQGTPSFLSGIAAYRESQVPEPVNRKIETEIQLLLSRSNVESVVKTLGITKSQLILTPMDYVKQALPDWLYTPKPQSEQAKHDEVVELFEKSITVEPMRSKTADTTSNVLHATFQCADKTLAPRALAALLQQYIAFGAQHNRELGESTFRLVDSKIREETAELRTLDDEILQLQIEQSSRSVVALTDNVNRSPDYGQPGQRTPNTSSLGLLKSETIEAETKLEEAQQLYTDASPNVRQMKQQLHELRGRLSEGVRATAELDARLERLDRQRALAMERFTELRKKRDQIQLYLQLNPVEADSRLITESPLQPDTAKKKMKIIVSILGPIAGFMLGLLLAGVREYFDHRLQNADDVKRYLGLDTLGVIPKLSFKGPR